MPKTTQWFANEALGNYFRMHNGVLEACPMLANGSRGSDEEICDVDMELLLDASEKEQTSFRAWFAMQTRD